MADGWNEGTAVALSIGIQPVPAGGYESAATGGGATTPHASNDANAPTFVSNLAEPWERVNTSDGHQLGGPTRRAPMHTPAPPPRGGGSRHSHQSHHSESGTMSLASTGAPAFVFGVGDSKTAATVASLAAAALPTPARPPMEYRTPSGNSTNGASKGNDAPPTVRQLLHRLDELVMERGGASNARLTPPNSRLNSSAASRHRNGVNEKEPRVGAASSPDATTQLELGLSPASGVASASPQRRALAGVRSFTAASAEAARTSTSSSSSAPEPVVEQPLSPQTLFSDELSSMLQAEDGGEEDVMDLRPPPSPARHDHHPMSSHGFGGEARYQPSPGPFGRSAAHNVARAVGARSPSPASGGRLGRWMEGTTPSKVHEALGLQDFSANNDEGGEDEANASAAETYHLLLQQQQRQSPRARSPRAMPEPTIEDVADEVAAAEAHESGAVVAEALGFGSAAHSLDTSLDSDKEEENDEDQDGNKDGTNAVQDHDNSAWSKGAVTSGEVEVLQRRSSALATAAQHGDVDATPTNELFANLAGGAGGHLSEVPNNSNMASRTSPIVASPRSPVVASPSAAAGSGPATSPIVVAPPPAEVERTETTESEVAALLYGLSRKELSASFIKVLGRGVLVHRHSFSSDNSSDANSHHNNSSSERGRLRQQVLLWAAPPHFEGMFCAPTKAAPSSNNSSSSSSGQSGEWVATEVNGWDKNHLGLAVPPPDVAIGKPKEFLPWRSAATVLSGAAAMAGGGGSMHLSSVAVAVRSDELCLDLEAPSPAAAATLAAGLAAVVAEYKWYTSHVLGSPLTCGVAGAAASSDGNRSAVAVGQQHSGRRLGGGGAPHSAASNSNHHHGSSSSLRAASMPPPQSRPAHTTQGADANYGPSGASATSAGPSGPSPTSAWDDVGRPLEPTQAFRAVGLRGGGKSRSKESEAQDDGEEEGEQEAAEEEEEAMQEASTSAWDDLGGPFSPTQAFLRMAAQDNNDDDEDGCERDRDADNNDEDEDPELAVIGAVRQTARLRDSRLSSEDVLKVKPVKNNKNGRPMTPKEELEAEGVWFSDSEGFRTDQNPDDSVTSMEKSMEQHEEQEQEEEGPGLDAQEEEDDMLRLDSDIADEELAALARAESVYRAELRAEQERSAKPLQQQRSHRVDDEGAPMVSNLASRDSLPEASTTTTKGSSKGRESRKSRATIKNTGDATGASGEVQGVARAAASRLMRLGKMLQDKGLLEEAMATYGEAADLYKRFGDDGKAWTLWEAVTDGADAETSLEADGEEDANQDDASLSSHREEGSEQAAADLNADSAAILAEALSEAEEKEEALRNVEGGVDERQEEEEAMHSRHDSRMREMASAYAAAIDEGKESEECEEEEEGASGSEGNGSLSPVNDDDESVVHESEEDVDEAAAQFEDDVGDSSDSVDDDASIEAEAEIFEESRVIYSEDERAQHPGQQSPSGNVYKVQPLPASPNGSTESDDIVYAECDAEGVHEGSGGGSPSTSGAAFVLVRRSGGAVFDARAWRERHVARSQLVARVRERKQEKDRALQRMDEQAARAEVEAAALAQDYYSRGSNGRPNRSSSRTRSNGGGGYGGGGISNADKKRPRNPSPDSSSSSHHFAAHPAAATTPAPSTAEAAATTTSALGSAGTRILHALRRGVPQPLEFSANHQHERAYTAASHARNAGHVEPQPAHTGDAASFLASVQSPELMERRRRERQHRRAARARQAAANAAASEDGDTEGKENAANGSFEAGSKAEARAGPRKRGMARWFSSSSLSSGAPANSTAKSRAASKQAVSGAVAWELEKADLLRDLTPRERALVLTFSDRTNFRAAVAAIARMRDTSGSATANSSARPGQEANPVPGSPTRLRNGGVRV